MPYIEQLQRAALFEEVEAIDIEECFVTISRALLLYRYVSIGLTICEKFAATNGTLH